jgi:hypothetical protein
MAKKMDAFIPYPPSWHNRFFEAIDRLPVPNLLVYILLSLGLVLLDHLVPWLEGKLPWGKLDAGQFNFQIWFLTGCIAFDYLLSYSKKALTKFRPAMKINEQEYEQLSYRFTHLSARAGWLVTLATLPIIGVFSSGSYLPVYLQSGWSRMALYFSVLVQGSLWMGFTLYLYRVLSMIRQLYSRVQAVNIFHLEPIYAFSGLTSRVGIFFVLTTTLGYFTTVLLTARPDIRPLLFTSALDLPLAVAAFIWPLGGIHKKLQEEKERVNDENDQRLYRAYKELHQRIDRKNTVGMGDFRSGLSALLDLRQEIKNISTWPWDSATLRTFIAALFVPLTVWLVQQVLLRTVAK